jgi:hypothetical protein
VRNTLHIEAAAGHCRRDPDRDAGRCRGRRPSGARDVSECNLVECPRCHARGNEPLWSLSVSDQNDDVVWSSLCADCYRSVLKREPPEQFARENLKKIWRRRRLI